MPIISGKHYAADALYESGELALGIHATPADELAGRLQVPRVRRRLLEGIFSVGIKSGLVHCRPQARSLRSCQAMGLLEPSPMPVAMEAANNISPTSTGGVTLSVCVAAPLVLRV